MREWGDCVVNDVPTLKCLEVVFGNLMTFSSGFVVLILFVMLVIGSFKYLTSGGDEKKVKDAQSTIMYAVIGVVLFVLAFLIIKIIDSLFLGGTGKLFKFTIN